MAEDKKDAGIKAPDDKVRRPKGQGRAGVPPASRSGTEGRPASRSGTARRPKAMGRGAEGRHAKAPKRADAKAGHKEIGGRKGPDPTRYGDWEQKGRCIDF